MSSYALDFCIIMDASGKMGPIIETVRKAAKSFIEKIIKTYFDKGLEVEEVNVRVMDFADFATEGNDAIHMTDFLAFPQAGGAIAAAIDDYAYAGRGGDVSENGLEALYLAVKAPWPALRATMETRRILWMATSSPALPLQARAGQSDYDEYGFPADLDGLRAAWDAFVADSNGTAQLMLFAPDDPNWAAVAAWPHVRYQQIG